jgi:hypothetical protein
VETDSIPRQAQEQAEERTSADLVVGILAEFDQDGIALLCEALRRLPGSLRIAVLQNDHVGSPDLPQSNAAEGSASLFFAPLLMARPDSNGGTAPKMFATYQSVFTVSEKLGARACCVVASKIERATPEWVSQLARPLLEGDLDLVVPHYASRKFEGLLNSSVVSPLTRSLYGKRIRNPMGPDLGVSQRLFQRMLGAERADRTGGMHPLASLAPAALCENMKVC